MKESYKKKWLMPALSCAVIAMTGQSKAQVIVEFEQIGNDVVATWSGIINLSSSSGSSQANHTEASATVLVTSVWS